MHVSLFFLHINSVQSLYLGERSKSRGGKNLSLTSCEHTRAVNSGKNVYLSGKRSYFVKLSAVNTSALIKPCTHNLLLHFIHDFFKSFYAFGEFLGKVFLNSVGDYTYSFVTYIFVVRIESVLNVLVFGFLYFVVKVMVDVMSLVFHFRLAYFSLNRAYEVTQILDYAVSKLKSVKHNAFLNLVCACFNHNDFLLCSGNRNVHLTLFLLLNGRIYNKLTVNKTEPYSGNGAVPGYIRY